MTEGRGRSLRFRTATFLALFAAGYAGVRELDARQRQQRREWRRLTVERFEGRPVGVFGDSHEELAVDDRATWHVVNFATASEHYAFTLPKLRLFRPRVAVIGCWAHSFLPYYDDLLGPVYLSRLELWDTLLTDAERTDVRRRLDFESRAYLAARRIVPFLGSQLHEQIAEPRRGYGAFQVPAPGAEETSRVDAATTERRAREWLDAGAGPPSAFQVGALGRTLEWAEAHGIPVVLLSTPVHARLRARMPAEALAAFRDTLARLGERHRFRRWDYSDLALPDAMFRDPDHLNLRGAEAFTQRLVARLEEEGLLARDRGR